MRVLQSETPSPSHAFGAGPSLSRSAGEGLIAAADVAPSVLALVDQCVLLDPRHHRAQPLADLLDRVLGGAAAQCLEARLAGGVFQHPFARETAGLDVGEDLLHLDADMLVDDSRGAGVIAILGGIRNRVSYI